MTTFALVHGAWHGSWCWERLTPELVSAGHAVVAVDLPCDDPAETFETYAEVVVHSLQATSDDIVLVGHSLAGHTILLVAARRPVRALVYLCALLPTPGRSFVEQLQSEPEMLLPGYRAGLESVDEHGTRRWVNEPLAHEVLYGDCDHGTSHRAYSRLRPQATVPYTQPCPLASLPAVPVTYVVCTDDGIVNPQWSRQAAVDRLGATVVELPGSHSPFLSRPHEVAAVLLGSAAR